MKNRQQTGKLSKIEGELAQKLAKAFWTDAGCIPIRIEDGAFITKLGLTVRKKQICDFIVLTPGSWSNAYYLIDVKKIPYRKITPSKFLRRGSSTNRQYERFLEINDFLCKSGGYDVCYFHFVDIENDKHYMLNVSPNSKKMHGKYLTEVTTETIKYHDHF